jgi:type II secretory pathway pseudopilin PulG
MPRRGLTLLELLIAIGLVVALGALVFPTMMGRHRQRTFDSTIEIIRDQLLLARAHAQATGVPVEVMYYSDAPHVEARMFRPERAASRFGDADGSAAMLDFGEEPDEDLLIPEGWAYRHLAEGVHVTRTPPQEFEDGYDDPFGSFDDDLGAYFDDASASLVPDQPPRTIRLAVFLPDGSALLGEGVWVVDNDGRARRIEVNPWTGLPIFGATAVNRGAVEVADDAEPDEELEEFERDEQRVDEGVDSEDTESMSGEDDRAAEPDEEPNER